VATLNRDAKGWRVLVVVNGERRTIRLGSRVGERSARRFHENVTSLAASLALNSEPDTRLVTWLAGLPDGMHTKLVKVGLAKPRVKAESVTLAHLWDRFVASKVVKPATAAVYRRVRQSMEGHFGSSCLIDTIGRERAEGWVKSLADAQFAPATRSKLIHVAKALFRRAVLWDLRPANPFDGIRPGPQTNAKRAAYVSLADLEKILDACPSNEWRCIFGMARLAGLRCPSELSGLRWGDLDFEAGRMTITSPKTEHHADGAVRLVPIVPRLHELLMEAFTEAAPGAVYVVPRLRDPDTNLRTHAHRILTRAGIEPPPKLFVNLRASRVTDWAVEFGGHVAAKWCGHSPTIALKHYAQVRPEEFARAAGRDGAGKVAHQVAQNGAETVGKGEKPRAAGRQDTDSETPVFPGDSGDFRSVLVPAPNSAPEREWAILDSNQ
jgi:integrase